MIRGGGTEHIFSSSNLAIEGDLYQEQEIKQPETTLSDLLHLT
jgi:hypothetical protein